jgi:hypothetical protein
MAYANSTLWKVSKYLAGKRDSGVIGPNRAEMRRFSEENWHSEGRSAAERRKNVAQRRKPWEKRVREE